MKKKVIKILMTAMISMFLCTGCITNSTYENGLKAANSYALYFTDLINIFSINSESKLINSTTNEDSILIEYDNGDLLNLKFSPSDDSNTVKINYTSDNFFTTEEIEKMVYCITCDEPKEYEKKIIKKFVEHKTQVEFNSSDSTFYFNLENNAFSLECVIR